MDLQYITMHTRILTLSRLHPLRLYTLPYCSNPPFLIFDIRLQLSTRSAIVLQRTAIKWCVKWKNTRMLC